jgi:hypothetical protein
MSETPIPVVAVRKYRTQGILSRKHLSEINETNIILGVLKSDPQLLAQIQDDLIITPDFITALEKELQLINQHTSDTIQAKVGGKISTLAEIDVQEILLNKIHYIQSKAKQKYFDNPEVLKSYDVGENISVNRAVLETVANNLINKLKTDTLPKITAQHISDLQTALDNYKQSQVNQTNKKGAATTIRSRLKVLVEKVVKRRRTIQHAADGEFPHYDPDHAGVRQKLHLPSKRALKA